MAERRGSFRKAPDLLALKQPDPSRSVRLLEEELGIALFERTNSGVSPTPVQQLLQEVGEARFRSSGVSNGEVASRMTPISPVGIERHDMLGEFL